MKNKDYSGLKTYSIKGVIKMVEIKKDDLTIMFEAFLAFTQNGAIIDELDILSDKDWDNIDNAHKLFKKYLK